MSKGRRGGRIHGGALAAQIMDQDWIDGSRADNMPDDDRTASLTMANDHPKSKIPPALQRYGRALDPSTSGQPQPGIGVDGALPIGAFQS